MPGWNPWVVLCVAEDAPYEDVQRSFRRMVKQTHPDGGGDARAFDAVVRAFEDIRRTLPREPGPGPAPSTPYDMWLRPFDTAPSWTDVDGPGNGPITEPTGGEASATMTAPGNDFTAVLCDEMSKVKDLVTA